MELAGRPHRPRHPLVERHEGGAFNDQRQSGPTTRRTDAGRQVVASGPVRSAWMSYGNSSTRSWTRSTWASVRDARTARRRSNRASQDVRAASPGPGRGAARSSARAVRGPGAGRCIGRCREELLASTVTSRDPRGYAERARSCGLHVAVRACVTGDHYVRRPRSRARCRQREQTPTALAAGRGRRPEYGPMMDGIMHSAIGDRSRESSVQGRLPRFRLDAALWDAIEGARLDDDVNLGY